MEIREGNLPEDVTKWQPEGNQETGEGTDVLDIKDLPPPPDDPEAGMVP